MAMKGLHQCAVRLCIGPISEPNNLCDVHRISGSVVRVGESTMVVTVWLVQHKDDHGVIFLNDYALGDLFGGRVGFEASLTTQGFTNVRLLHTPEELKAELRKSAKKVSNWSGPWRTRYPWENGE